MRIEQSESHSVSIYIAGNYDDAVRLCKEFCLTGFCVSIERCAYIYTGGMEDGVRVNLINYARFPARPEDIDGSARKLAEWLMGGLFQQSASIVGPDKTIWLSIREESNGKS